MIFFSKNRNFGTSNFGQTLVSALFEINYLNRESRHDYAARDTCG
jgi:hypothetical protein